MLGKLVTQNVVGGEVPYVDGPIAASEALHAKETESSKLLETTGAVVASLKKEHFHAGMERAEFNKVILEAHEESEQHLLL